MMMAVVSLWSLAPSSSSGGVDRLVENPEVGKRTCVASAAEEINITVEVCGVVTGSRLRHDTPLRLLDPDRGFTGEIERPEIGGVTGICESIDQPDQTGCIVANQRRVRAGSGARRGREIGLGLGRGVKRPEISLGAWTEP